MGLFFAVLTGAVWDSPLVTAPIRAWEGFRSPSGRHAMR
jgi:hypothetical protein